MLHEKACTKCGEVKPAVKFRPRPEVASGLSSWCRACLCKQVNRVNNPAKRKQQKERLIAHMGGKCMKCGGVFPYYVYDLHHRDPAQKEINLNSLNDKAWERVIKEAAKCDLFCANCHRIEHHAENDNMHPPKGKTWSESRLEQMATLIAQGLSHADVATAMGMTTKQVSNAAFRHHVRSPSAGRPEVTA